MSFFHHTGFVIYLNQSFTPIEKSVRTRVLHARNPPIPVIMTERAPQAVFMCHSEDRRGWINIFNPSHERIMALNPPDSNDTVAIGEGENVLQLNRNTATRCSAHLEGLLRSSGVDQLSLQRVFGPDVATCSQSAVFRGGVDLMELGRASIPMGELE